MYRDECAFAGRQVASIARVMSPFLMGHVFLSGTPIPIVLDWDANDAKIGKRPR